MRRCHKCGHEWTAEAKTPGVKETCEQCVAYLHCCRNCRFFDPAKHNQCHIGTTDWVADKEGANFCDEFEFKDSNVVVREDAPADKARIALDSLFGKTKKPIPEVDAFKKLFGD